MNKKPGRNDPCPCGSGKKYKQCCWSKEKEGAKTYTPSGKRKFKATVLSGGNIPIFDLSTSVASTPDEAAAFKFRMTNKDFREKNESGEQKDLSFESGSEESPKENKQDHKPGEPFQPTKEDFRSDKND